MLHGETRDGSRLCDFSMANGLVIRGGTLFQHKDIHKATWVSANGRVKNQIDHLLISRQLRSAVLDARVQKRTDIKRSLPRQDQHPTETRQVCQHEEVQANV